MVRPFHIALAVAVLSFPATTAHAAPLHPRVNLSLDRSGAATIVAHPAGCPWVNFCGCGVSVRAYGHPVRALFRAAAWHRLRTTTCAAGTVAIFGSFHVAYVEQCDGAAALMYDPNSGGRLTRLHWVKTRGLKFVDPRSRDFAEDFAGVAQRESIDGRPSGSRLQPRRSQVSNPAPRSKSQLTGGGAWL